MFREDRSGQTYDKKRKFWYSNKGTYGTAGWMTDEALRQNFSLTPIDKAGEVNEIIYGVKEGNIVSRKPDSPLAGHIAVFGASGSMKSRAFDIQLHNINFQPYDHSKWAVYYNILLD